MPAEPKVPVSRRKAKTAICLAPIISSRTSAGKARTYAIAVISSVKKRAAKGSPQDFRAMQFNLVVSTNEDAIRLWQKLSFEIIGTLPGTFHHPRLGYVDAFVMCKQLAT